MEQTQRAGQNSTRSSATFSGDLSPHLASHREVGALHQDPQPPSPQELHFQPFWACCPAGGDCPSSRLHGG